MKLLRVKRLRKKAGSVLFIVIIVMAMLIALATGAYYTAYTARLSIVDNYNYSQLYLSATSISDMAISALSNTQTDTTYNNFETFTKAVQGMKTVGQTVTAESSTDVDTIPGMVDYYKLAVKLEKSNGVMKTDGTRWEDRYYIVDAEVGFADDQIEIETLLYCQVELKEYDGTFDPGTDGWNEEVIHYKDVPDPGETPTFDSFFITTGQNKERQVVKISVNKITDDAYFKNDVTYFSYNQNQNANNTFYKDLTSTGSICFDGKFSIDTTEQPNKDWYIGEDLLLMNDNASKMDLGNDGTLYVGGDLVINNQQGINAKYIYVLGDLYLTSGQSNLTAAGVYVAGNIYTSYDASAYSNSNGSFGTITSGNTNPYNIGSTDFYVNGDKVYGDENAKNKINSSNLKGGWDTTIASSTLDGQMDKKTYSNYATNSDRITGIDTLVDIDLTLQMVEGSYVPVANDSNYYIEVDGQDVTITITAGNCTINSITGADNNPSYFNYQYVFDVDNSTNTTPLNPEDVNSGDAVYVRLAPNCVINGSGNSAYMTDEGADNTGFTWLGASSNANNQNNGISVITKGDKNDAVVFEMAPCSTGVTSYFQGQRTFVGSSTIYDAMGFNPEVRNLQTADYTQLLDKDSNIKDPDNVYNNVFLISTSDSPTGFQIETTDSGFAGYAYAPYMDYTSTGENNTGTAILGGLIVNAYDLDAQRDYTYVVPNNDVLGGVFSNMDSEGSGGSHKEIDYIEYIWHDGTPPSGTPGIYVPSAYAWSPGASNYVY